MGCNHVIAQEYQPSKIEVKKHTVMELYEPDLILSVDERKQLKKKRKNTIERRKRILDTLTITERRRQRLLKALHKNPFSNQLNKALADIEFEEDIMDK